MYSRLALKYGGQRNFEACTEQLFKALDIYKSTNNDKKIISTYHNIGDLYRIIKDTINATKYLKLSSKYDQDYPASSIRTMNNGFLGEIYLGQNRLKIAEAY